MGKTKSAVPVERIEQAILFMRGQKVMLDRDLAGLYGVTTGNLNKAVNRNSDRFPDDFMFLLTGEEFENLKFHFGTSSWGGTRKLPRAFTEQGVLCYQVFCVVSVQSRLILKSCVPLSDSGKC